MASCLGLFIDNNIIKYAKVSKEKDNLKVESFGVNFYEKLEDGIKQVIEETYSYKVPISVNLAEENYEYFDMYSLLNKNDLPKAIKTEFEAFCGDKGYNPNVFETRYALIDNLEDKEKLKVIHVSNNKIDLNKRFQQMQGYKLTGAFPIGMSIPNLNKFQPKENTLIVNIEGKTTITTVIDQKIYDVKILDVGSEDFLTKINLKENSYSKAYEICKETTIYTSEGKELGEEATYLEDIMPTLYEIVGQVKKVLNESLEKIEKVYITGTAALINNIDLYFEEYLENAKCEILKPDFIKVTQDLNIKDYIEVNSAISLALMGLNVGIKGMNFKQNTLLDQLKDALKVDITPDKKGKEKKLAGNLFTNDLTQPLDATEKALLRITAGLLMLFIIYSGFSALINNQMEAKSEQAQESIANTNRQISAVNSDNEQVKAVTSEYTTMIQNLQEINDKIADTNKTKKAIPNLLTALMSGMPEDVQITSIKNTSDTHIEIIAQSRYYDQLGFLKAKIKTDGILQKDTVISSAGEKNNDIITMKIEGDLP